LIEIKPRIPIKAKNSPADFPTGAFLMFAKADVGSRARAIAPRRTIVFFLAAASVAVCSGALGDQQPDYALNVAIDVGQSKLVGTATIDLPAGTEPAIHLGALRVLSVTNGSLRTVRDAEGYESVILHATGPVEIRYEGTYRGPDGDVIDADKIVLHDMWYPVVEGTYRYRLTATLPRDFTAVSEADTVRRTEAGGQAVYSFDLPYPQEDWSGITFVASRHWVSRTDKYKDIDISIHVLQGNASRLDEIAAQTRRYLEQLEGLLGDYPFKRLTVAENPVAITYSLSMVTYVLLSQRVVAAVTPEENALNHEIAHQWFGDAVLADYDGGNWAEGLASYFSDDLEGERMGRAWERRQRRMATYQNNVEGRESAFPLASFEESNDRASRFIGYGKAAIVVHMLRRLVGDEIFFSAMRDFVTRNRFRVVSWTDIRQALERAAGTDLGWFFAQWVDGVAIPELGLDKASAVPAGGKYELRFTVTQKPPALRLNVPATIYFDRARSEKRILEVLGDRNEFRYVLDEKPVRIVLDEDYDVFRELAPEEMPPTVDNLLTRPRVMLVGSATEQKKFASFLGTFESEETRMEGHGASDARGRKSWPLPSTAIGNQPRAANKEWKLQILREADAGIAPDAVGPSLILLGKDNPLIAKLFGRPALPRGGFTVTVLKHPKRPGGVVAILTAVSKAEVDAGYREVIDRPRYSSAAFDKGKLISRELREGQRGISKDVGAER
jgi:hypothetical protein